MPQARLRREHQGGAGRDIVSIGPLSAILAAGRSSHRLSTNPFRPGSGQTTPYRLRALVLALATSVLVAATPALGAERTGRITAVQDDTKDASDGGYVAAPRQIVVPSVELGLSQRRPIPLGATCSCTIDRVGLTSQFDITVL